MDGTGQWLVGYEGIGFSNVKLVVVRRCSRYIVSAVLSCRVVVWRMGWRSVGLWSNGVKLPGRKTCVGDCGRGD